MGYDTRTVRFARAKATGPAVYMRGLKPDHPDYGVVQLVERTTVRKMRSDGYPDKKHQPEITEVVVMELPPEEAAHILRTLTDAVIESRTVTEGAFG